MAASGKWWERDGVRTAGKPEDGLVVQMFGGDDETDPVLKVSKTWQAPDGEWKFLRNQPSISLEDMKATPEIGSLLQAFLEACEYDSTEAAA